MKEARLMPDLLPDPVVAAMIEAGWSDAQIGAALRAAFPPHAGLRGIEAAPASLRSAAEFPPHAGHASLPHAGGLAEERAPVAATVAKNATVGPQLSQQSQPSQIVPDADVPGAGAGNAPLAKLRARIAGASRLSRAAARVGAAILDRYDRKTGLCVVGTDRIAEVAGVHRATVFRALTALEAAGLIARLPYAGLSHCSAYRPLIVVENATVELSHSRNAATPSLKKDITTTFPLRESQGPPPRSKPPPAQKSLMLPIAGGQGVNRHVLASGKAGDRLWKAFAALHGDNAHRAARLFDKAEWTSALDAERHRAGSGLSTLIGDIGETRKGNG